MKHPILVLLPIALATLGGSGLARGAAAVEVTRPIVGGLEQRGTISPRIAGQVLISELNCAMCHASTDAGSAPKSGPNLSEAGGRLHPAHVQRFIANPSRVKPGTTMPDVLASLPEAERDQTALALAHYLASLGQALLRFDRPAADSVARGRTVYHSVGCVACHAPESGLAGSVPLGPLEDKYSLSGLALFLEDPLVARPGGRMPGLHLDHFEALDLAGYLLRRQPESMPAFRSDARLVEQGRALFALHRCNTCHEIAGHRASPSMTPLAKARPDRGCLSEMNGPWPHYPLSMEQRSAIRAALGAGSGPLDAARQIEIVLTRLQCVACHQRDEMGGVPADRAVFFASADENLGPQGRLPPTLTGVGAKLKRGWLHAVMVSGASVRPYLHTRMPRFGEANTAMLAELLKQQDRPPVAEFEPATRNEKPREVGRELAGSKGFNCIVCHTFREKSASPIRALDLTTMATRLEENWFHLYLANPARFSPLTIMPVFWPDGQSPFPEVLGGSPGKQRDALWRYLSEGPEAGEPRGLVPEPLILSVLDEAVMLRRSYPGIGKRGIGVGYPAGIHLTFDAGQMRLASVWSGGFVEASGVWRGQGAGNVHALGRDIVSFPAGPAFAVLEASASPWPTNLDKQAVELQFKGYALDARQRPTFRYEFGTLAVEDRFLDFKDMGAARHFERTLSFPQGTPPPGLHLRVAADKRLEERVAGDYVIGSTLRLRLPPGGIVREGPGGRELVLPVTSAAPITIEYHLSGKP